MSLVSHFHDTGDFVIDPPHHNLWLRWVNYDGKKDSTREIGRGHEIPVVEPVNFSVIFGETAYKGTLKKYDSII